MCGFLFSEKNDGFVSSLLIKHRGPDDFKTYTDSNISIYNYRLSIVDQNKNNTHPFFSKSKNTMITFNGEIYNYLELSKKYLLQAKSNSEANIIAEFFDKFGISKLNELSGMFSIIFYNLKKKEVYFIRDRYGIKPLNYTFLNRNLYVSSEVKPLLDIRERYGIDNKTINIFSVIDYLYKARINHDKKTFFKDVFSVIPGHYIKYNLKNKKYTEIRYNFINKKKLKKNYLQNLEKLIIQKIKLYSITKRKSGVLLSGGVDSSLLSSISNKYKKIQTFTYGFYKNRNIDDINLAKKIASELGVSNFNTIVKPNFIIKNFDKVLKILESPFTSIRIFGIYKSYLLAKQKGCAMILDGQGGDEVFAGYKHHIKISNSKNSERKMKNYLKKKENSGLLKDGAKFLYEKLFSENLKKNIKKNKQSKWNKYYNNNFRKNTLLQNSQIEDMFFNTIPRSLHYVDRLSMVNGVEARLPLLDNEIVDYGFNLPDLIKADNIQSRKIIRNILKKHVSSPAVIKKYVADPQTIWMRTYLKDFILKEFNSKFFKNIKIFNSLEIKKSFIEFLNGENEIPSFTFFQIFSLSRFMRVFKIK